MTDKKISPRRGRPRNFDIDRTIDTARDLFYRHGFDGVGIAEISKATGLNPPSLYSAFGNKFQLLERAVERYAAESTHWLEDAIARSDSPGALVRAVLQGAADAYTRSPDALGCLALEATRNSTSEEARALTEGHAARTREALYNSLAALGAADPTHMADYVQMIMRGLSAAARTGTARETLRRLADTAANAVDTGGTVN